MNCTSIISATSIDASGEIVTRSSKCWMTSCRAAAGSAPHNNRSSARAHAAPPRRKSRPRDRGLGAKLYLGNFAFGRRADLEKFAPFEIKHPRQNVRRELRDFRVVVADHGVVVPPRILDVVLNRVQRLLQLIKAFNRTQLRI